MKYLFTPVSVLDNILVRLQSALSAELNQSVKLPRLIVLVLDRDFVSLGDS